MFSLTHRALATAVRRPNVAARPFSAYEDYSNTSNYYDQMRRPLGLDDLDACFERGASGRRQEGV